MPNAAVRDTHGPVQPLDVVVALALTAFCILVGRRQPLTFPEARPSDVLQAVAIALTCLPLAVRRPMPAVAAIASTVGCALYVLRGYTGGPVLLVPLLAMFPAGYALSRRDVWRLLGTYTALMALATIFSSGPASAEWIWLIGWPPIAAALALAGHARRRHDLSIATQVADEERRQHAEALQQLAVTRLEMARELHDVLGHSLASIAILAAAGSRRVDADPDSARSVLDEIRAVSATALAEVRHALDALSDPARHVRDAPDDDLGSLVERLRRVGLRVDEKVNVDLASLAPETARALHRIAQESLTNVMRHAGSLHAALVVERAAGGVEMTVSDWGTTGAGEIHEGLGIAGMRRRAEELGGQLTLRWGGEGERGGMTVVAWLPDATGVTGEQTT